MTIKTLEKALKILHNGYYSEIKDAYVDDFNSESASVVVIFEDDANLRSLNPKIKRFFKYYMNIDVFPNEFMREGEYYMFDVCYLYCDGDTDYLEVFDTEEEAIFIKMSKQKKKWKSSE